MNITERAAEPVYTSDRPAIGTYEEARPHRPHEQAVRRRGRGERRLSVTDLAYATDLLGQEGLVLGNVVPNFMCRIPLAKHGTGEQKKSILPATASGEAAFSFAITEPDAGTNTFKIRTTAIKQDDGTYLLLSI